MVPKGLSSELCYPKRCKEAEKRGREKQERNIWNKEGNKRKKLERKLWCSWRNGLQMEAEENWTGDSCRGLWMETDSWIYGIKGGEEGDEGV